MNSKNFTAKVKIIYIIFLIQLSAYITRGKFLLDSVSKEKNILKLLCSSWFLFFKQILK